MKRNHKRLYLGILIAVAVISAIVIGFLTHKSVSEIKPGEKCNYIVNGTKYQFSDDVTLTYEDKINQVIISDDDLSMDAGTMPLYTASRDRVFLTENVAYYREGESNNFTGKRLTALTELSILESTVTIKKNEYSDIESDGFLYDGRGAYIFIEPVKLTLEGKDTVLPALSYLKIDRGNWIEVYDAKTGEYTFEELNGAKPEISSLSDAYQINLNDGIVIADGKETMFQSSAECFVNYFN